MDRRQLLIAGVIAPLAVLVVVLALVLVRGSGRDDAPTVTVRTDERPPGMTRDAPAPVDVLPSDPDVAPEGALESGPDVAEQDVLEDELSAEDVPDEADGEDGLEAPPRRAPRSAPRPARPEPAQAAPSRPAPVARPAHEAFARDYLARQTRNTVSDVLGLYATSVRYYAMGTVSADAVAQDKAAYFRRFPDRSYRLIEPVRVTTSTGTGAATLRFDYEYAVGGGPGGERSGTAWVELDVVPSGDTYLIRSEHGSVY